LLFYGALGAVTLIIYVGLSDIQLPGPQPQAALGPPRKRVYGLAALFSVDAFGGGFIASSLLALWLFQRFGLSATAAGAIFFTTGVCSSLSYFAAAGLAKRFGLVNTMVFHTCPPTFC
jgi:hypothetical protein